VETLPCKFGRYELLELIATGGMAHIFRARLTSAPGMTKELVIKRVLPHLVQNREFIDMFMDEARIAMPLTHGNVVQVFEFGQEGEETFLAMEYVRGRNLETVLRRVAEAGTPLPLPLVLFIGAEVAKGLDYAHRFRDPHNRPSGIIHRDVSPQNVLVGFQGEVKLTDFGIAKARSKIHQTSQGIIRGKAAYLSPEQAECRDIDARSDQFSLGAVLYEMLTGVRPFEGDTEVATLQKVRQAAVEPPSQHRPEVPPEVDAAVLRALARRPEQRFETCGALQVALSRALQQVAPEFTSAELADWMAARFAGEITHEIEARAARDRLLEQLGEQGDARAAGLSTGELLQMGTMDMQAGGGRSGATGAAPAGGRGGGRRRRGLVAALLGLMLVAGGGIGLWLGGWPDGGPAAVDGGSRDGAAGGRPDAGAAAVEGGAAAVDAGEGAAAVDAGEGAAAVDAGEGAAAVDAGEGAAAVDAGVAVVGAERRRNRWAWLNLNASPWALVEIDGRRLAGETPLFKVRVRAGFHRLRFFNPELNIEKIETVSIRPGRIRTISVRLEPPAQR
jgi:tRNA A-37 threonylcarbamoyl transferase component Bud32